MNRTARPRLDPHAPLVLDTRELGRQPGSVQRGVRQVPAPPELGSGLIWVPAGAPVELSYQLEAVVDGVLVTARARAFALGECGRCLGEVRLPVDARLVELFCYPPDPRRGAREPVPEDLGQLDGDLLDLEPALRDAVVLDLPLTPLCSPDCPGLCPTCGRLLAEDPGHTHDQPDPRWAALSRLSAPGGPRLSDTDLPSRE